MNINPSKSIKLLIFPALLLSIIYPGLNIKDKERDFNLMPVPAQVIQKDGKFRLTESFRVAVENKEGELAARAASRLLRRLSGRTGLFFPQDCVKPGIKIDNVDLQLIFEKIGKLDINEDESYSLIVKEEGIELSAETDIGVLRGLETLLQLLSIDEQGYFFPVVIIHDKPRFPWRGLLIDSCRHFMPIEVIKRNLDGMAAVKMNVLHWHLSEDQGFRIECKTFPKLHELGSDGLYYSQQQIRDIIAYAADRGIRIVPEFDIPGHSTSWLVGYPELASAPGPYSLQRRWGVFDPTFDPTREETYQFFNQFFAEISELFPDPYIHIGGDEVNGVQWDANPKIQEFMEQNNMPDNAALQTYFNKRILKILTKHGKKIMGWDEIFQPDLPKSIIIQSWRGQETLKEAAQKGYKAILSNGYYIDLTQSTQFHYLNDPIPEDSTLTAEERKMILGGEATMWGELISPETIDSRIWPRTAAIAERLWSPPQIKNVQDMYRRLEAISFQLEEHGLTHLKNQDKMLRRLTNNIDTTSLKVFVDVVEPVKLYARHRYGGPYTSYSPLTRMVDAALPDSKIAREFNLWVGRFLEKDDKEALKEIKEKLTIWKENHKDLIHIINRSPILKEIEPLSEDLCKVSELGLQSIHMIVSDEAAQNWWVKEKKQFLETARQPRAEVELMIVYSIEKLVDASSLKIEIADNWQFRQIGKTQWYKASVPGSVHTDLFNNRLIDDPFYRDNEKKLQWIENEEWEYKTSFVVKNKFLRRQNIDIHFQGLDTYADVYLNGILLFKANNMFREWKAECKKLLKVGENQLRIHFYSPIKKALPDWKNLVYELPGGPKVVTRKAGYHYGWDFGPRFATSGIWRPVYLQAWDIAKIENLHIINKKITNDKAELAAVFEIKSAKKQKAIVSIGLKGGDKQLASKKIKLIAGINSIKLDFQIDNPQLWWTNGLGEAHLYRLLGRLLIEDRAIDEVQERIGLRTIEVVQEVDNVGKSFYIKLNGVPVFMKGANYVPQDSFLNCVTPEKYQRIIKNAVDADMNMLRVWGGGIYEKDSFYDLCDENGILVWQDFMFACAMYPGNPEFIENVKHEAIQNVKRLRNHPCIALWCGNNEIDEGWHNWGWQKQYGYSEQESEQIWRNYRSIFHGILPKVVEKCDPGRFYYPSSPKFGWGHSESLREGDSHYWGVWWGKEPFEIYNEKVGRFMSEYGFQSLPEFETIKTYTMPEDHNMESEVMKSHQKHPTGNQLIKMYMERDFRTPKDFESFIHMSQVLQAEGMKVAIEAHRRAMPYCMGSLYWQLNDCWPGVSWSSIDYFLRPKVLYYYARKAFSKVLISAVEDNDMLNVYIISDNLSPFRGLLKLRLLTFKGELLWEKEIIAEIKANSSSSYYSISLAELLKGGEKNEVVFLAEVWYESDRLSRNLHYFLPPKELNLPISVISKKTFPNANGYSIELTPDKLVKNVFLEIENAKGFFTDNYFDLLPNETVEIDFITKRKNLDLDKKLEIKSLIDTYE